MKTFEDIKYGERIDVLTGNGCIGAFLLSEQSFAEQTACDLAKTSPSALVFKTNTGQIKAQIYKDGKFHTESFYTCNYKLAFLLTINILRALTGLEEIISNS